MTNKETVLVTGSSGFLGFALCNRLSERYNVIGFDRPGQPHPPPSAYRVDVDLGSDADVAEAIETVRRVYGNKLASVVHLAAYYDFSGASSPLYDQITVQGTARLLRNLRGFELEQFIFSSTMLVHAPTRPGEPITEESPVEPTWDYPASKVKTEALIRRERGKTPVVMVRLAGVYDDDGHSLPLAHQIQRIRERDITSRFFPGDASHGQTFIHLDDSVAMFERLIERRHTLPQELVLLAGEPQTVSYETLQQDFGRLLHGKPWPTTWIPRPLAKAGAALRNDFIKPWMIDRADDHYELDISRAVQVLDWRPVHSLKETLPKMIQALKADPARWYEENGLKP